MPGLEIKSGVIMHVVCPAASEVFIIQLTDVCLSYIYSI